MLPVHFVHADLAITATIAHRLIETIPIKFTQMYSHVLLDTATVAHSHYQNLNISLIDKVNVKGADNTLISFLKGHTER